MVDPARNLTQLGWTVSMPPFLEGSNALFALGLMAGFIAVAAVVLPVSAKTKRRVYWTFWAAASALLAFSGMKRGLGEALLAVVAVGMAGLIYAFYFTPFIKIGGQVRSFWISNAREDSEDLVPQPDSYLGRVTAAGMWWNLAGLGLLTGGFAMAKGWLAPAGMMAGALLAAPLAAVGYLDRRERFPIARGRFIPFAIVTLTSVPLLLWPVVAYFVAYFITSPSEIDDGENSHFVDQ